MCDPHFAEPTAALTGVTSSVTSASHAASDYASNCITAKHQKSPINTGFCCASSSSDVLRNLPLAKSRSYEKKEKLASDCEVLSDAELRKSYPAELTSWHGMLRREKDGDRVVAPEFREFRRFLQEIGPCPKKGFTVDRIDNANKTYGPGLIRWADKKTQNNNKSDTNVFTHPKTGKKYGTGELARKHRVDPSTIRQRKARGWSDEEQIAGKKLPIALPKPDQEHFSNLVELEDTWFHELDAHFENAGYSDPFVPPINGKDRGMLKAIRERTPPYEAAAVIRYAVRNWVRFVAEVESSAGVRHTPRQPRLDFLARYPDIAARAYLNRTTDEQREELRQPSLCRGERKRIADVKRREAEAIEAMEAQRRAAEVEARERASADQLETQRQAYLSLVAERGGLAPLATYEECLAEWAELLEISPTTIRRRSILPHLRSQWREVLPFVQLEQLSEQQRKDYAEVDPEWFAAAQQEKREVVGEKDRAEKVRAIVGSELEELL